MLEQLPRIEIPNWLADLTPSSMKNEPIPLRKLIENSLYYPCSGLDDGSPIKHLSGNIVSFLYVDYGKSEEDFMIKLRTKGFLGYHVLETRKVTKKDLTPNGWQPGPRPTPEDGNPLPAYRSWAKKPFFIWTVLERNCDYSEGHGPIRFSFLYLCSDGVATFQALYLTNGIAPKAVAIIQPGMNWTNFEDRNQIFARSVIDSNPGGCPEYLLDKGSLEYSCWRSEYKRYVCSFNGVNIWKRPAYFATEKNTADGLKNS